MQSAILCLQLLLQVSCVLLTNQPSLANSGLVLCCVATLAHSSLGMRFCAAPTGCVDACASRAVQCAGTVCAAPATFNMTACSVNGDIVCSHTPDGGRRHTGTVRCIQLLQLCCCPWLCLYFCLQIDLALHRRAFWDYWGHSQSFQKSRVLAGAGDCWGIWMRRTSKPLVAPPGTYTRGLHAVSVHLSAPCKWVYHHWPFQWGFWLQSEE